MPAFAVVSKVRTTHLSPTVMIYICETQCTSTRPPRRNDLFSMVLSEVSSFSFCFLSFFLTQFKDRRVEGTTSVENVNASMLYELG